MHASVIQRAFNAPGPFATVCADVTHNTESAGAELELRVRAISERLAEQGADEPVVQAVRDRLLEGNEGGEAGTLRGRAIVADSRGNVVLDARLADAPRTETTDWSPQPDLLPVIRALPGRVPHLVVVADRVGADITIVTEPGHPALETTVEGQERFVHKFPGGGWSALRYMHNSENVWMQNADKVAEVIDQLVGQISARFVLLAGEERARAVLADRVTSRVRDVLVTMDEGGRAAGADREPIDRRAAELVAEHEAREDARVLEQVQAASAHGLAVTGTDAVVEALRKAQVETLVLADDLRGETLLVGDTPLVLGVDQHDMDALGTHGTVVPADRALLAAVAASDAEVVVVPRAALPDKAPVAAVLRYTDDSTPSAR
ncbi:Vms1/Ankzf1 family peptidyl-tRNA hydrolase [Geodermatophilus sp. YIM 151500]|uniref:baeRF2 domain-containing protein n=1 Tax=Geodermatophilus sp. YIM 151500 TaxID=2984531 RepID=UPI0021E4A9C2|nr:Vms1/Ankzf1 family peptidyl-tRNA hydrolase [Geodermatophilus sp. YIM 151500]MCV2490007.1 Vms1/Ankzf1 family peptidyl-tRNA hydrolase [Geodermatophilus sp. YIM 151500]